MEAITIHASILVITDEGKLLRIYCPFPVQLIKPADGLQMGLRYKVSSVRMGRVNLYVIANEVFQHHLFIILPF